SWDPATGLVTTVAGGGSSTGDGPALLAQLTAPLGAAVAPDGRVVFGDSERLRAVVAPGTPAAAVVTIAGQPGTSSCTAPAGGAGSVADQIALDRVADLVVAGSGDIFLADGSALERVDPQGRLTLLA